MFTNVKKKMAKDKKNDKQKFMIDRKHLNHCLQNSIVHLKYTNM